jgi:hypothetical protein
MSTKTNFKRIALVAVAALGMGLLSSAPSQAAFQGVAGSQLTITAVNGTGTLEGAASDSTTAATVTVSGLALANSDSYTITAIKKSWPALTTSALTPTLQFMWADTATSTSPVNLTGINGSDTSTAITTGALGSGATAYSSAFNSTTDSRTTVSAAADSSIGANSFVVSKWYAFQESLTSTDRIAGTYVYTLIVTPNSTGTAQVADISITIAASADASLVASNAYSTLYIGASGATADEALSKVSTASETPVGYLNVNLKNASNVAAARESVTITTTAGLVGNADVRGRSVVMKYSANPTAYNIYADGSVGVATITVSTPSVTFPAKTITFYAKAAKTITATVGTPLLGVGDNAGAVRGVAVDANGNAWTGTAYIVASSAADALVAGSVTPVSCGAYDATNARHNCPVTAIATGTAKFKIIDASTVALATATSNEVTVTVSAATAASVKISFDKATYAPNERARIYVTPLDASGKEMQSATYTSLLAAGGIAVNGALSYAGSTTTADSLTATSYTTAAQTSATSGARAGSMQFTVYMPSAGGVVTLTATGGTALPLAARTAFAVTASATVTDSGAAALAAVNALATTVASLKTLITTLTNLVLKIQKKVKA